MRAIVEEILTGKLQTLDLEIFNLKLARVLSGPTVITGEFPVDLDTIKQLDLTPYRHMIHIDVNGYIVASCILKPGQFTADGTWKFEAEGFSSYPNGLPYMGEYEGVQVDPLDMVRKLWAHVQSFPNGNLGVIVDKTSSKVRIGNPPKDVNFETNSGDTVEFESGPYKLNWWDGIDCGKEIIDLAKQTPFDYEEVSRWVSGNRIEKGIKIGYPRLGKRRDDLRFRDDENIMSAVTVEQGDNAYATDTLILGAGEGRRRIKGTATTPVSQTKRIRRVLIADDKSIRSYRRADNFAKGELKRANQPFTFSQIVVNADHQNAIFGSYNVGDDILVHINAPWVGEVEVWHRILGYQFDVVRGAVTLSLERSDAFTFGYGEDVTDDVDPGDTSGVPGKGGEGTTGLPNYGEPAPASPAPSIVQPDTLPMQELQKTPNLWAQADLSSQPNTERLEFISDFYTG